VEWNDKSQYKVTTTLNLVKNRDSIEQRRTVTILSAVTIVKYSETCISQIYMCIEVCI
jgi:hypothetical protein